MAEKFLDWPSDLSYGRVEGRFGWMSGDAADENAKPDLSSIEGYVTITPSIDAVHYNGEMGYMYLVHRPIMGILDSDGYLCTKDADGNPGPRGMVLPASDNPKLNPSGFTYRVTVVLDGHNLKPFNVRVYSDKTTDLVTSSGVPTSKGVVIVSDVSAAVRAETAASDAKRYSELGRDALAKHVSGETPHRAYDLDIPDLSLLFESKLV